MSHSLNVRVFAAHEWRTYKDLRLRALADAPDAFGSTFAKESERPDTEWQQRLALGVPSARNFPVVAEIASIPIGLAWGRIEESTPDVANVYQVWVMPTQRRLGAGQMLLKAVIAWATTKQARYLDLGVTCGDSPAMRLYARLGFEPIGQPHPIRPGADVFSQPMRLNLINSAA